MTIEQRRIVAIIVPIVFFLVTFVVARHADSSQYYANRQSSFNFQTTWWVWLMSIMVVGFIEFKLFKK